MDHRPKCKIKTIKLLEDVRVNLCGLGLGRAFLHVKQKAIIKEQIDKLGFITIKNFYSSKCAFKRMNRQATD